MAIYHLTAKIIGRSSGRDSTSASAYRAGVSITDKRTGLTHDYTKRIESVIYSEVIMPDGITWNPCRSELWNAVELKNKRKDAQTAREVEIALPAEISDIERLQLASVFAKSLCNRYGIAADIALHAPRNNNNNYHAHIMLTTDKIEDNKIGRKVREMNSHEELKRIREAWQDHANAALERAGHDSRIDHRTLESQGIDREPTIHEGVAVTAMERKGITTEIRIKNSDIQERNAERETLKLEIKQLEGQKAIEKITQQLKLLQTVNVDPAATPVEKAEAYAQALFGSRGRGYEAYISSNRIRPFIGVVLRLDENNIYQQTSKGYVAVHLRSDVEKILDRQEFKEGEKLEIGYNALADSSEEIRERLSASFSRNIAGDNDKMNLKYEKSGLLQDITLRPFLGIEAEAIESEWQEKQAEIDAIEEAEVAAMEAETYANYYQIEQEIERERQEAKYRHRLLEGLNRAEKEQERQRAEDQRLKREAELEKEHEAELERKQQEAIESAKVEAAVLAISVMTDKELAATKAKLLKQREVSYKQLHDEFVKATVEKTKEKQESLVNKLWEAIKERDKQADIEPIFIGRKAWQAEYDEKKSLAWQLWLEAGGSQDGKNNSEIERRRTDEYATAEAEKVWEAKATSRKFEAELKAHMERQQPGINQELQNIRDEQLQRFEAQQLELERSTGIKIGDRVTYQSNDGQYKLTGILYGLSGDTFDLQCGGQRLSVLRDKGHLEPAQEKEQHTDHSHNQERRRSSGRGGR